MKTALLIALTLCGVRAIAEDKGSLAPIGTDRPSFSDGPQIVPLGHLQLESGFTHASAAGNTSQTFPEMMYRLALSERFEVRLINVSYESDHGGGGASGFQDSAIGFKYQFLSGRQTAALVGLSTLPTGSRDFRTSRPQPTVKVAWEYASNTATTLGANLSVSDLGPNPERFTQYYVSAYINRTFSPKAGGFLEWYDVTPLEKDGTGGNFADVGTTYLLDNSTQVDFRIGSGFNERRDGWYLGAGISHRF